MLKHVAVFSAIVAAWAVTFAPASAQQLAPGEKKVWDGVYTGTQAARGKAAFETACSGCHNRELSGSQRGPALKGDAFWSRWEDDNLGHLYTLIRDTMPPDGASSTVTDAMKVDILAYILSVSGIPAGDDELTLDLSALEGIKVARITAWDGVGTAMQAERGKINYVAGRCTTCHQAELQGDRGPALKGQTFLSHWENATVNALFEKIRDTMPLNAVNELSEYAKIDLVAFLLQANGFPSGKTELRPEAETLGIIDIVPPGRATTVPNFSLVQVVGCLTKDANNRWTLTRAGEPAPTRDEEPPTSALRAARDKALGTQNFQLLSVDAIKPDYGVGQKVEARGLLYKTRSAPG